MGWFSAVFERHTLRVWTIFGLMGVIALATIAFVGIASANPNCTNSLVGSNFEIDPDGNLKVDAPAQCIDWLTGGAGTSLRGDVVTQPDKDSGATDDSFGQGTAENDANPTIVDGSIPPNKSDLKVFGVHTETTASSKFLQLFWSRVQNPSGTTNMDFELNQKFCDPTATPTNCANNKHQPPETPVRTKGDKLITYDLAKGGTVPKISIRTWTANNQWSAATVISGGTGNNACNPTTGNNCAIGSVNSSTIPADVAGGINSGNDLDPFTFGEASVDFKAIFSSSGTCGSFGSAYLKSRSSDSFQAELKDFIKPHRVNITNCTGLTTTATQKVTIGSPISDTATLSGGANPTGTITFHLFPSLADCQANTNEVSTGLTPKTVNGNGDYNSGDFTPTAVGTYFWIANYSGDANNVASATKCDDVNEQSEVVKQVPAISTNATGNVTIGDSISDTAHLTGATNDAGGKITFTAYGPDDTNCSGPVAFTSEKNVNGNGDYTSDAFTPTAVGTYRWIASYSGDGNNEAKSTACNDANESSVVAKQKPAISTNATASAIVGDPISDTAHLTGATNDAGGKITFKLYGPNDANCSGTVAFTSEKPVSGNGDYTSDAFNPTKPGTYRWIASYSGDGKNEAATSACNDANESTDVVQKQPAISTKATESVTIDSPISDTATLTGATNDASGTITFKLYSDDQCSNEVDTGLQPVQVNGNGDYNSGDFTPTAVGTYYWTAKYSGDAKNLEVSTPCRDANESSVVNKANSNVQTKQSLTPQDSADLSAGAGGTPTGDVTFKLYGPSADPSQPPDCSGNAVYTQKVGLTNGSASTSNTAYNIDKASEGTYSWQVSYDGDSTHKPVTSCVEHFTVSITNGGIVTSS